MHDDYEYGVPTVGTTVASVGVTASVILPADKHRVAIIFPQPDAGSYYIAFDNGVGITGGNCEIKSGDVPLIIDRSHHGALATFQVWAIAAAPHTLRINWSSKHECERDKKKRLSAT